MLLNAQMTSKENGFLEIEVDDSLFVVRQKLTQHYNYQFSSVQLLSHVRLFATPWTAACQAFPVHHQLLELAKTNVHRVSDAIQPSHPLSSPSPPAFSLSQHQSLFQ